MISHRFKEARRFLFSVNLWASLNRWEKTELTTSAECRQNHVDRVCAAPKVNDSSCTRFAAPPEDGKRSLLESSYIMPATHPAAQSDREMKS